MISLTGEMLISPLSKRIVHIILLAYNKWLMVCNFPLFSSHCGSQSPRYVLYSMTSAVIDCFYG